MARPKLIGTNAEESAVAAALRLYTAEHQLTQRDLATTLKTSQATISRVLRSTVRPDPALRARISALLAENADQEAIGSERWVQGVIRLARKSELFAELIKLGLHHLDI